MTPGSYDITAMIRGLLSDAIAKSPKSRETVAAEMSDLTGKRITVRMLNDWTSQSKEQHRFPLAFTPAFCQVVGDCRIIEVVAERADRALITSDDQQLLQLGRQYLAQKQAAEKMAQIEARIHEKSK